MLRSRLGVEGEYEMCNNKTLFPVKMILDVKRTTGND